jgi:hypothetical protein
MPVGSNHREAIHPYHVAQSCYRVDAKFTRRARRRLLEQKSFSH